MLQELVIAYLKKSKIKLLYSFYLLTVLILIPYNFNTNYKKSKYNLNDNIFKLQTTSYNIDGDKLTIEAKGREKILANYYFKNKQEKEKIEKNLELGDILNITGEIKIPNDNDNFNSFNYRKYLLSKKIKRIISVNSIEIAKKNTNLFYNIKNIIIKKINKIENNEYIYLFIMGKNNLDNNIKDSYSKNGISHLFAISGMHISLITLTLSKLLNIISKKKKLNFVIITSFLFFFLFLTDYMPSIIRASFMYIIINIKKYFKVNISNLFIIFNIFLFLLLINPYYIYNLGFVFSFVISFALIYFSSLINKYKNYFQKLFMTSLVSFVTSIPILIYNFHEINFISILANMFFVPFVSYIVFPIGIFSFFFSKLNFLLKIVVLILEKTSNLVSKINILRFTFSHPSFIVIILYIIFIFLALKKKKLFIILLFILLTIHHNFNYFSNINKVNVISIGQGDCILIKLNHNKGNILIDTGGKTEFSKEKWQIRKNSKTLAENTIIPYLKSEGISKLDYLVLTHGDYDHMGESISLVDNFKINNVVLNCGTYNDLEKNLIKVLNKKKIKYYSCIKELNIDKYKLQFLNTKMYDNENDNSNVIFTKLNNYKFLFMGDAGVEKEKDILKKYNLKNIDFLKVGHHGSNTSSGKHFINQIKPKYSLISVGKNNRYGHPKEEVLNNLEQSKIYRTDLNGSIEIKLNKNGYKIKTCSP